MSATDQYLRRPYTGSCHCGHVKYIVYLSLPTLPYPKTTQTEFRKHSGHRFYKCNCTICHKAGLLHLRPLDAANDFFIISPKDPKSAGSGLKSYISNPNDPESTNVWGFCEHCGVRAFALRGNGYNEECDVPTALLQRLNSNTRDGTPGEITAKSGELARLQVWRPKKDWQEHNDETGVGDEYLSINALSLDAHNENFDLRQLQENGYVSYMQTLQTVGYDFEDKPYFGGTY